jgi:hypothetical protein
VDIIIVLVFISLILVVGGLVFFFSRLFQGDFEHGDRLSLLPLEDDDGTNQVDAPLPGDKLDKMGSNSSVSDPDTSSEEDA